MREVLVDVAAFAESVIGVVGIEPVEDYDNEGEQSRTRDGVPKWKLQVLHKNPRVRKPEVVEIGFAAHRDGLPDMADAGKGLFFRRLRVMLWEQGNRHGLAMSCEAFSFGPWTTTNRPDDGEAGVAVAA